MMMVTLAAAAALQPTLNAPLRIQDEQGTYVYNRTFRYGNQENRVRYTLVLRRGGRGELNAEKMSSGGLPTDGNAVKDYGWVMSWLNQRKRVNRSGDYEVNGNRLTLFLMDYTDGRREEVYRFQRNNNGWAMTSWDKNVYGNQGGWQFRESGDDPGWDNPGGGNEQPISDRDVQGSWIVTLRVVGAPRQDRVDRRLVLSRGGRAEMRQDYIGQTKVADYPQALKDLGAIAGMLSTSKRTVSHTGRWRVSNNVVLVDLDAIDGRRYLANFKFALRDGKLTATDWVRAEYGTMSFSLSEM